jgi:hypothetical protein
MRALTRTWRAIPWPGALLALAAWGLLAPVEAKAGCRHPGVSVEGSLFDRLMVGDEAPLPLKLPLEHPASCKGPSCSGEEAPPSVPVTVPTDPGRRWALGAIAMPDRDDGSAAVPLVDARPRPVHTALAIFHPPRLSTSLPTS